MGLPYWAFVSFGIVVGQVSLIVPLAGWWQLQPRTTDIEVAVTRAVTESLRVCLELDTTTTTTFAPWALGGPIGYWHLVVVGLVFGFILIVAIGCCCIPFWFGWPRFGGQAGEELADCSPKSPPLSIESLARNQLATLRVRRHAQQSNRAIGV